MTRIRIEVALTVVLAGLAGLTLLWPAWIESLSGLEPDAGSGGTEWWLVGLLGVVAVGTGLLARRDRRRAVRAGAVASS
jgi:hypothetical protein